MALESTLEKHNTTSTEVKDRFSLDKITDKDLSAKQALIAAPSVLNYGDKSPQANLDEYKSSVAPLNLRPPPPVRSEIEDYQKLLPTQKAAEGIAMQDKWLAKILEVHAVFSKPAQDSETAKAATPEELQQAKRLLAEHDDKGFRSQLAFVDALAKAHTIIGDEGLKLVLGDRFKEFTVDSINYTRAKNAEVKYQEQLKEADGLSLELIQKVKDFRIRRVAAQDIYFWLQDNKASLAHIQEKFSKAPGSDGQKLAAFVQKALAETQPQLGEACVDLINNNPEKSRLTYVKWADTEIAKNPPPHAAALTNWKTYIEPLLQKSSAEELNILSEQFKRTQFSKDENGDAIDLKQHLHKLERQAYLPANTENYGDISKSIDFYFDSKLNTRENIDKKIDVLGATVSLLNENLNRDELITRLLNLRLNDKMQDGQFEQIMDTYAKLNNGKPLEIHRAEIIKSPLLLNGLTNPKLSQYEVASIATLWAIDSKNSPTLTTILNQIETKDEFKSFNKLFTDWINADLPYENIEGVQKSIEELRQFSKTNPTVLLVEDAAIKLLGSSYKSSYPDGKWTDK